MIKKTHFDKDKPENNNIKKKIKKDKFISVKKKGRWIKEPKEYMIDKIIEYCSEPLNDRIYDMLEELKGYRRKYYIDTEIQEYLTVINTLGHIFDTHKKYVNTPENKSKRKTYLNIIDEMIYDESS